MAIKLPLQSKWLRSTIWLIASLALLVVLAWALVPPLLKSQVEKMASEELGRNVTLGRVDFKPWTLELELGDIAIAAADGATGAQLLLKRIYIDVAAQSILRLAPVVDAISVEGLKLKVTHFGNGSYDFDDVLTRLANRAKTRDKEPSVPPRFALFNIALLDASLDFADKSVGKTHELRDLKLTVPFLSNLDSQREVKTEPHLAFNFNGSSFDSNAQSTPFTETRRTDASIHLKGFDLKPYLGYLPASVPLRLVSALVNADIKVAFEQASRPSVKLTGAVEAKDVKLTDRAGQDLLSFAALKLALQDVRPLEQVVKLSMVELTSPQVTVARDKMGHLNLDFGAEKPNAMKNEAIESKTTGAMPSSDSKSQAWKLEVAAVAVRSGLVSWNDDASSPKSVVTLNDVTLDAKAVSFPIQEAVPFSGSMAVQGGPASFRFEGSATDRAAEVSATIAELPLTLAAPYLSQFLVPGLSGSLDAELKVNWKPDDLALGVKRLTLGNLALVGGPVKGGIPVAGAKIKPAVSALASLKKLEISSAQIGLARQTVTIEKVVLTQPATSVTREKDGHWMFEPWLKNTANPKSAESAANPLAARKMSVAATPSTPAGGARPWAVFVTEMALEGGAFQFHDQTTAKPVVLDISAVKVQLKNFSLDGTKAFGLSAFARIKMPEGEPGHIEYKGNLGLSPVSAQGNLVATQIPVHAFEPYFADLVNIELLRADVGFKGDVRFASSTAGPVVMVKGDSVLEEFRANGAAAGQSVSDELLSWKALGLRGLEVSLAPGKATTVTVAETALTDFFARILVNEAGRINLQDLLKSSANADGTAGLPAPAASEAPAAQAAQYASGPEAIVNIGPVSLINGRVHFTDHFVKPNYSANLSELNGRLSAFSSVPGQARVPEQVAPGTASSGAMPATSAIQMADLELRGRAEGTASLEILGKLNPLAKPLALDIKGKVRDLELPPLSPYSVKYAGHGIERGKLSVDVAYVVLPDGQLSASNNIILNQLKFGDKVEGAPNSLPVQLAVALLADRNGVIDINLPVSGSLDDPQFRLGPIIFKVIVNLIVKAITSPFSLLASAFGGGGDELSQVSFAAGTAALATEAQASLDKVAKALTDRPGLKLTVVGSASLEAEREAYKRERLKSLLQAEKRRAAVVGGASGSAVSVVTDAEAPALLKEVYKRSDMPKPRNLIGMAKDIPDADMQALILANIVVSDDVMRELALQRGVAVKDYLVGKQLPVERLFLGAVKAGENEPKPDAKWTPRAELSLLTN